MTWVKTAKGRNMPLDPDVDDDRGNVILRAEDNRAIAFASPAAARAHQLQHGGDGPYVSHFATCSDARRHRRRRAA